MTTLTNIFNEMKQAFQKANIASPAFEARVLLTGLFELTSLDMVTCGNLICSPEQLEQARKAMRERLNGKPVHRILGWREFYGLKFQLSKDTLEPRPDTETLVDVAIAYAEDFILAHNKCDIIDLGTGTGAIALSVLHHCPKASALGIDHSDDAIATALLNAKNLQLSDRFSVLKSDWISHVQYKFDMVLSNPPYISKKELPNLSPEVLMHDPLSALDGGEDGLDAYHILSHDIPSILKPNGIVGLEIGWQQVQSVIDIFEINGFKNITKYKDLSGHDRVLLFKYQ